MVDLTIMDFGGRYPKKSKRLLPANFAQEALNVDLESGELRGYKSLVPVVTLKGKRDAKRGWRILEDGTSEPNYWITSEYAEAELVKSPLINDEFQRWFLFEPGQPPKVFTIEDIKNGTGPWELGLEQPKVPPTLSPFIVDETNIREVVYVYTLTTEWGEETAPSEPATVQVDDAGDVEISGFEVPPPPEGRDWQYINIYRSVTSGGAGELFWVAEIPWDATSYLDNASDAVVSLNRILDAQNFQPPPDGIYGARVHPSGAIVAFKGRDVYFSEPYRPHAWPSEYRVAVSDIIVGIEVFSQNVGVFTQGRPVGLYGATPAQIGILKYSYPEPCLAYGSIISSSDGAYYASHQGIVRMDTVGPAVVTKEVIPEGLWESEYLTPQLQAARYGTQYIALKGEAQWPSEAFVLDTTDARLALVDVYWDKPAIRSLQSDYYTGHVFAVGALGEDAVIYRWDDPFSEEIDYMWRSRQEVVAKPVNMGAVMVHLEPRVSEFLPADIAGPPFPEEYVNPTQTPNGKPVDKRKQVLVEIYADGKPDPVDVVWCSNREQVRLKSGHKSDTWELRITGQCRVYSVALTETGKGMSRAG